MLDLVFWPRLNDHFVFQNPSGLMHPNYYYIIITIISCSILLQFSKTVLIQTIQFSKSIVFVYTQLNVKTVLILTIQFSVSTVLMSKTVLFETTQFNI